MSSVSVARPDAQRSRRSSGNSGPVLLIQGALRTNRESTLIKRTGVANSAHRRADADLSSQDLFVIHEGPFGAVFKESNRRPHPFVRELRRIPRRSAAHCNRVSCLQHDLPKQRDRGILSPDLLKTPVHNGRLRLADHDILKDEAIDASEATSISHFLAVLPPVVRNSAIAPDVVLVDLCVKSLMAVKFLPLVLGIGSLGEY